MCIADSPNLAMRWTRPTPGFQSFAFLIIVFACLSLLAPVVAAAQRNWSGGGGLNNRWSEPLNWAGGTLPMPGDDLQFANPGTTTLTTLNDLPAGSVFGSMILAGGKIDILGTNAAAITGNIQITQPSEVTIEMPLSLAGGIALLGPGSLALNKPLTLTASQVFETSDSNAVLRVNGSMDIGPNNLVIRNIPYQNALSPGIVASVFLSGDLTGSGSLTKEGMGELDIPEATNQPGSPSVDVPLTTVNAGTLSYNAIFSGKLVVNGGARLQGGSWASSALADVDVDGGTFAPAAEARVTGTLQMFDGATLATTIANQGTNGVIGTGLLCSQQVQLIDCSLRVNISPNTNIKPGTAFPVISGVISEPAAAGTFDGLPEGSRFVLNGQVVTVTYQAGSSGTDVALIVGAPFVWVGFDARWSWNLNWVGNVAPVPGSDLVFNALLANHQTLNDLPPGISFRSITFGGPDYSVAGNSFVLTGSITNSGQTFISADFMASGRPLILSVADSSRLELQGNVTGAANWIKAGRGTLRLSGSGADSQSRVQVLDGNLELAKSPGIKSISSQLIIGNGTNAPVVRLFNDEQMADAAAVTVNWPAKFQVNGRFQTIGQLWGNGLVDLTGPPLDSGVTQPGKLTIRTGSSNSFSGTITGTGDVAIAASASAPMSLSGTNTFAGSTILSNGTLQVDGIQTNSTFRLEGGVLTGRGWVGPIVSAAGGVVDPGLGLADFQNALHCFDVTFNPATVFHVKLTSARPNYENHKLQVTGAVNLGGCQLELQPLYAPSPGQRFVLIENDGTDPIVGTFAGLPQGAVFTAPTPNLKWRISYMGGDGNDVTLTLLAADSRLVLSPPTISSTGGMSRLTFSVSGMPLGIYDLQASSDLTTWTTLFSQSADSRGLVAFSLPMDVPRRFYRLKLPY